jgi:hypothetical protein
VALAPGGEVRPVGAVGAQRIRRLRYTDIFFRCRCGSFNAGPDRTGRIASSGHSRECASFVAPDEGLVLGVQGV